MFVYRKNWDRFPLLIIQSPGQALDSEIDQDSFYERAEEALSQPAPVVVLHDLTGARVAGPVRRKRFVDYANNNADRIAERIEAYAVLIDSHVFRGVITAILWFVPPPCPLKVFTDQAKAIEWLKSMSSTLSPPKD